MVEFNGTRYYTKLEIKEIAGCSLITINNRIAAMNLDGYYIGGHCKYYTADQVTQIVEYRKKKTDK